MSVSPTDFATGCDSPVSNDSSTLVEPRRTIPSNGDTLSGTKDDDVIGKDGGCGQTQLAAIFEDACLRRLELRERADCIQRALACTRLQPVAEQQEAKDEEYGVVVKIGTDVMAREQRWPERGDRRVAEGRKRAERDQRMHVCAAVTCRSPGALIHGRTGGQHAEQGDSAQRDCKPSAVDHRMHAREHDRDGGGDGQQCGREQTSRCPSEAALSGCGTVAPAWEGRLA